MNTNSTNNFFNRSSQSDNSARTRQLFLLTGLSLVISAMIRRVSNPAMFLLLGLILTFAAVGTAQTSDVIEFRAPVPDQTETVVTPPQETGNIFSSRTEDIFSFNLESLVGGCQQFPISYGQTVFGRIDTSDCVVNSRRSDEYTFNGTVGQQIDITWGSSQFFGPLELLAPNGTVLASSSPNGAASRITRTLATTGTYTIRIGAAGQTYLYQNTTGGNYYLSLAEGSPACEYFWGGAFHPFDSKAYSRQFGITATPGCSWAAFSSDPWITITDGNSGSGNGIVKFSLTANDSTVPRRGSITIAGLELLIYHSPNVPCPTTSISYGQTINSDFSTSDCITYGRYSDNYTFNGTAGDRIVISTSAASPSPQLVRLVLYKDSPDENLLLFTHTRLPIEGFYTLPFTGTYKIDVGAINLYDLPNNTGNYTISLTTGPSCVYTLSSSRITAPAAGSQNNTVNVLAETGCPRTAVSNAPWITITSGSSGSGNGIVTFDVAANPSTARSGTISIVGQTFTVDQLSGISPPNDNSGFAQGISGVSGSLVDSNVNATAEPNEPAHAGLPASHSVWYRWRAPEDGLFSFSTSGSSFDTRLAVYTRQNFFSQIAANDDNAPPFDLTSKVVFRAQAGTDYFIAVDGKNNQTGIVKLAWKQAARSFRFYAQTGNGNISPRTPDITAVRQDGVGRTIDAQPISPGVFELDLPVDNFTYVVSIGGTDIWEPNSFLLSNTSITIGNAAAENAPETNGTNLTTYAVTPAATVSGELVGITNTPGLIVFRGSESEDGLIPLAPRGCSTEPSGSNKVKYTCQFIVDTDHQIKPLLAGIVFEPSSRRYKKGTPTLTPTRDTEFRTATAATYNISGRVTANGNPLEEVQIRLSGSKNHSFITLADGKYTFNNLPAGGNYLVEATLAGYTFAPKRIDNLQKDETLDLTAQNNCSYRLSATGITVGAVSGSGSFEIITENGCPWTVANSASWLNVSNASGSGRTSILFTVEANNGIARSAGITVGEQSFTLTQADGCRYSVGNGGGDSFAASGGVGSFTVTALDERCTWTAETTDYCMVSLSGGGTGSGTFNYTIAANPGVRRSAVITVAGERLSITQAAAAGTHRTKFDFDGDGKADLAVYRPSVGVWYVLRSSDGFLNVGFGLAEDLPVAADYDGDGRTDVAVYRPSLGAWYRLNSSTGEFVAVQLGMTGDQPTPADYDGDGKADIAVYRPSNGTWYRLNSSSGEMVITQFGMLEDKPVAADYDGDGKADIAVYRPSNGVWYRLNSTTGEFAAVQFGAREDQPVAADYDGDGRADIAVYRGSVGVWYRLNSGNGEFAAFGFGQSGDIAAAADYNGDRRADIAVFRPTTGEWYVWSCTNNPQFKATRFGVGTDRIVQTP